MLTVALIFLLQGIPFVTQTHMLCLSIHPLHSTVVAYLEHGAAIRSVAGLKSLSNHNLNHRDEKELLGVIARHVDSGDQVVKSYLLGYPIADLEAAKKAVKARHVRARERRKEVPLLWQGPAVLDNTGDLSTFRSYVSAVEMPELEAEQFAALHEYVADSIRAEAELRDLGIRHSSVEVDALTHRVERGRQARRALIVRHLGLVVQIASEALNKSRQEMVGIGNVALAMFVETEYQPEPGEADDERFRRQAILAIMDAMPSYYPKYRGKPLKALQDEWLAYEDN
jgi:hypothetical protein